MYKLLFHGLSMYLLTSDFCNCWISLIKEGVITLVFLDLRQTLSPFLACSSMTNNSRFFIYSFSGPFGGQTLVKNFESKIPSSALRIPSRHFWGEGKRKEVP